MGANEQSKKIRVIRPDDVRWGQVKVGREQDDPPGRECVAAMSDDEHFSCGLWQRDVQHSYFERPHYEIAYILEGEVEVTDDDGNRVVARAGDILITPKGSKGQWKNLSPVKKFWTVYEEQDIELEAYLGPGGF
ncbi:MAG: cupin domain-containing protein [Mycobacteriaceae bacterium]